MDDGPQDLAANRGGGVSGWSGLREWFYGVNKAVAASRVGSWVFARALHRIDRLLLAVTGGRVSIPGVFAGVPVVRLTTVGAKTGQERTVPVLGLRDGEGWVVVASNWGQRSHPGWYHNLQAHPVVEVTHSGETGVFVARDAISAEREDYWAQAMEVYPWFDRYRERAGDREIPIVLLTPADSSRSVP